MQRLLLKERSLLENKYLQLSLLYILSFSIPFLLKSPQLLVGSLVNFVLILSITQFKFKEVVPALVLPSISAYTYGLLFGGATNLLLYLIPFIVIGNAIYVLVYKNIKVSHLRVFLAAFFKASFLFICTYILFKTVGLPKMFLSTMGISQFVTAIVGGFFANTVIQQ